MRLIPKVTFHGTSKEVGRHHGTQLKPFVLKVVDSLGGNVVYTSKQAFAARLEEYLCLHFPEIIEKFEGIGEGAEIGFERSISTVFAGMALSEWRGVLKKG